MAEKESQLKQQRDEATEQRKTLWRQEAKLDSVLQNCKEEIRKAEHSLSSSVDKSISNGIAAVARIAQAQGISSNVFGPVFELFEADERFRTAIEVAAGASLFHVVVDTDITASKLLDVLNQEKSGRVTFIPLNRIKPKTVEYPQADDAIPLIQRLKFDQRFQPAFEQIFGGILVCPNLEVAASYSKSHGLNVVTMEGDRVDRRGALSGGYVDIRNSRLEAAQKLKAWQTKLAEEKSRGERIKADIVQLDQQITSILGELQLIETQKKRLAIQDEAYNFESKLRKEQSALTELVSSKVRFIQDCSRTGLLPNPAL